MRFVVVADFGSNTAPSKPQLNLAIASTASSTNAGHSYNGGNAVNPANMIDSDISTNAFTAFAMTPGDLPADPSIPTGATGDSAPPTPIFLQQLSGFKSVKLTNDADNSGNISAGDTVTWTVSYANTTNTVLTDVVISDTLETGLTVLFKPQPLQLTEQAQ